MIINVGAGSAKHALVVTVTGIYSGATVTVTNGSETFTQTVDSTGKASFNNLSGAWTVTASISGVSQSTTVTIDGDTAVSLNLRYIPEFTYDGTYKIVDDTGTEIANVENYYGNFQIQFLTGGTLGFQNLYALANGIDLFLVGGGGRGEKAWNLGQHAHGGPGYNDIFTGITLNVGMEYAIVIGAGSTGTGQGGSTSAFGETVAGGYYAGAGGTQTYAFGSADMGPKIYCQKGTSVQANTGNGGTGSITQWNDSLGENTTNEPANGSSGIAILRNRREVA